MLSYNRYTSLKYNINIYLIQRESQRINFVSSVKKVTALLTLGPIKNSVSVKQFTRTQWIWVLLSCEVSWQRDHSHPAIKKVAAILQYAILFFLNDETSLVYHNPLEHKMSLSNR